MFSNAENVLNLAFDALFTCQSWQGKCLNAVRYIDYRAIPFYLIIFFPVNAVWGIFTANREDSGQTAHAEFDVSPSCSQNIFKTPFLKPNFI